MKAILQPSTLKDCCVKELTGQTNSATWNKLSYQISHPPRSAGSARFLLAWPRELVTRKSKNIGFMMPLAFPDSVTLTHLTRQNVDQDRGVEFRKFDLTSQDGFKNRAKICLNVCAAINLLYSGGDYIIIDLKPDNILVTASGNVTLVDLDSIMIREKGNIIFDSLGGTEGYKPPEGIGGVPSGVVKDKHWDAFSLAIIIYQVLVGAHPYAGGTFKAPFDKPLDLDALIKNELFVFGQKKSLLKRRSSIHETYEHLPDEIKALFQLAFATNRANRPSVSDWGNALKRMAGLVDTGALKVPQVAKRGPSAKITTHATHGKSGIPVATPPTPPSYLPPPPPPPMSLETSLKWIGVTVAALFVISLLNSGGNNGTTPLQPAGAVSGAVDAGGDAAIGSTPSAVTGYEQSNSITRYLVRDTNVRQQPTRNSANITMLSRAEAVQGVVVSGTDPNSQWFKITSGPQTGYFIAGSNLSANGRLALDTSFSGSKRIYSSGSVYGEADRNSTVLQEADAGMTLNVVGTVADGLVEISLRSGVIGYVDRSIFSASSEAVAEPQGAGPRSSENIGGPVPQRRVAPQGRSENGESGDRVIGQSITCVLPYGQEVRTNRADCEQRGGSVY